MYKRREQTRHEGEREKEYRRSSMGGEEDDNYCKGEGTTLGSGNP